MGTVWLTRVLEAVANCYGLSLQKSNECNDLLDEQAEVLICNHSQHPRDRFDNCVVSHLIRDPRDAVVSGYYYHLWTDEAWAHVPQPRFQHQSYQQYLQSLDRDAGLSAEIERFGEYVQTYGLMNWDYSNSRVLELKYEDLIRDESSNFKKLFSHYGFHRGAIKAATRLALQQSFQSVAQRPIGQAGEQSHLRSGKPGEWKSVLTAKHCQMIQQTWGKLLIRMGYESDENWLPF